MTTISTSSMENGFYTNCEEFKLSNNCAAFDKNPEIPLLFIQEVKNCNICHDPISPFQVTVKCSNLCGKQQHLNCIHISDDINEADGAGIVWKCIDCCISDESSKMNRYTKTSETHSNKKKPVIKLNENGKHFVHSSLKFMEGFQAETCPENNKSMFYLDNKHTEDHNIDISGKSIEGTVKSAQVSSTSKQIFSCKDTKQEPPIKDKINKHIEYIVLKNGSKKGKPKLYDSMGFSYTIRIVRKSYTVWQCSLKDGTQRCQASVKQVGAEYIQSKKKHHHPSNPTLYTKAFGLKVSNSKDENPVDIKDDFISSQSSLIQLKQDTFKMHSKETKMKKQSPLPYVRKVTLHKKSSFIEVIDESAENPFPKLIDVVSGFSYQLNKISERTQLWLCTMSLTKKCEASVKQVGSLFIRSTLKHTHASSREDIGQAKKLMVKDRLQKVKKLRKKTMSKGKTATAPSKSSNVKEPTLKEEQTPCPDQEGDSDDKTPSNSAPSSVPPAKRKHHAALHGSEIKLSTSPKKNRLLSAVEEKKLIEYLLSLHHNGLSLTNKVLVKAVKEYFDNTGQDVFLKTQNRPSRGWVTNFMQNHRELKDKHIDGSLSAQSLLLSTTQSTQFYHDLELNLRIHHGINLRGFLTKRNSCRVFNCDGVELVVDAGESTKQLGQSIVKKNGEISQKTMNVLCCIRADGHSMKPFVVNKGDEVIKYEHDALDEFEYGCSADGEITPSLFYTWLTQHFSKHLHETKVRRPVILLLNGSHLYISYNSLKFAGDNGIVLYHFTPQQARLSQPLSMSVFPFLQKNYQEVFVDSLNCNTKCLPLESFPSVFMRAYNESDICGLAKSGFKEAGLCPWSKEKTNSLLTPDMSTTQVKDKDKSSSSPAFQQGAGGNLSVETSVTNAKVTSDQTPQEDIQENDQEIALENDQEIALENDPIKTSAKNVENCAVTPDPPNCSRSENAEITVDKDSLKNGYKLALDNIEQLISTIVDPSVLNLYRQKLKANIDYPDTTFLVWRGLQHLKAVPDLL